METSEQINELFAALAVAQGEFTAVPKSATNPHLKNHYATLDGVIEMIRGPLSKNGLSFVQPVTSADDGTYWLETRIVHTSGQWIASATAIPQMSENRGINSIQAFGGALTYMRRYMLSAMLGINADEDADGEGKNGNGNGHKPAEEPTQPPHWIDRVDPNGTPVRKRFWAWATGDNENSMGLTKTEVYEALGVEHIHDYDGSMEDARARITAWVAQQVESAEEAQT